MTVHKIIKLVNFIWLLIIQIIDFTLGSVIYDLLLIYRPICMIYKSIVFSCTERCHHSQNVVVSFILEDKLNCVVILMLGQDFMSVTVYFLLFQHVFNIWFWVKCVVSVILLKKLTMAISKVKSYFKALKLNQAYSSISYT